MAVVFMGRSASWSGSGLVKMADLVGAIFCSHSRDGTEPRMDGWAKIDSIVS